MRNLDYDVKPGRYCTGSAAEFNIATPLNCIGDVDIMFQESRLATTDKNFQLEDLDVSDMGEEIQMFQIEKNNCPNGFVYPEI